MQWGLSWIAWQQHHSLRREQASTGYVHQLFFCPAWVIPQRESTVSNSLDFWLSSHSSL